MQDRAEQPDDIKQILGQSPSLVTPANTSPAKPTSLALMAPPFDWIEIPAGRGTMKTNDTSATLSIPTESYWIAKYPITNAQFAKFIEVGGYNQQKWWTQEGWQKCQEGRRYDDRGWKSSGKAWTEPYYCQDPTWNSAEQPVVGVSWYEAVAFCLWLTDVTAENIMLPTEEQWQYAAQGDDGRAYPWGNDWDGSRCNNYVVPYRSNITTPVRHYEGKSRGDSPFGVVDMAGNVWEWCRMDYDNNTNDINNNAVSRVFRGGAWSSYFPGWFRCDFRNWLNPHYVNHIIGFRISRS